MNVHCSTLDNGLRIVTAEMSEAQSVTAAIFVGVGGRYENWKLNGGVSHILEHLLFKGTAKRPTAKQISEEIDAVGGWNNAYTSNELTCYYVKVPNQHAALGLDVIADLIMEPLFDPAETERERGVIIEEMSMIRDDPSRYVGNLLTPLIWPYDPIGKPVIGREEVVMNISRARIMAHKKQFYVPNNMVVSVAGQISHEAVVEQVSRQMGHLRRRALPPLAKLKSRQSKKLVESLTDDTNQAHFLIGCQAYAALDDREVVARVIATILGRGMSSRLFMNIREIKGLAYAVSADSQSFIDTGMFEVYAGANADKAADAVAAVLSELNAIRRRPVSKLELMKAKNQLRGGLQMDTESNSKVADRLGSEYMEFGRIWSIEELLADIDAVSVEDVQRVAIEMLNPERLRMAIIAPDPKPAEKTFMEAIKKGYVKS